MPVLMGRVSLLHNDNDTNENETGVGDRGLHGSPLGYPFPREGELAVAILLRLPAGNERGDPSRQFVVEGTKQWARAPRACVQTWPKPGAREPRQCRRGLSVAWCISNVGAWNRW